MKQKHILICGERGVGKSTLIRRLLAQTSLPIGGFVTKREKTADENGFFPIYIHPAEQNTNEWQYGKENLVGICDSHSSVRYSAVFDTLGVELLKSQDHGILLMDELGFLENEAADFQRAVLSALDGEIPVIAAVKAKKTDFLRTVCSHPNAEAFEICEENREELFEKLVSGILGWSE